MGAKKIYQEVNIKLKRPSLFVSPKWSVLTKLINYLILIVIKFEESSLNSCLVTRGSKFNGRLFSVYRMRTLEKNYKSRWLASVR